MTFEKSDTLTDTLWLSIQNNLSEYNKARSILDSFKKQQKTEADYLKLASESTKASVKKLYKEYETAMTTLNSLKAALVTEVQKTEPKVDVTAQQKATEDSRTYKKQLKDYLAAFITHTEHEGQTEALKAGQELLKKIDTVRSSSSRTDLSEMRKWLQENGYNVKDRGRVSTELVEIYEKRSNGS